MAIFTGSSANDTITPGAVSDDVIVFPANALPTLAADIISGGDGSDVIDGGGGADVVLGGLGADTITAYAAAGGNYQGDQGNDTFRVVSLGLLDTIHGGDGTDTFTALGPVNILFATLQGLENLALDAAMLTLGASQLDGFTTILGDAGAITGRLTIAQGGAAVTDIQGLADLEVTGSAGADLLTFTTSGLTKTRIDIAAGDGNDAITTDGGNDSVLGGNGADILSTGGGRDTIDGGADADIISGGAGNDSIVGGLGLDVITGGEGNDTLTGGTGFAPATSDGLADSVDGGAGDDLILAFAGLGSSYSGGADNDTFAVSSLGPLDTVDGGAGIDTFDALNSITIVGATIQNVEHLALDGATLSLAASQLNGFTTIVADDGATLGVLALLSGGPAITDVLQLTTLQVTGSGFADQLTFTTSGAVKTGIALEAGAGVDRIFTGDGDDTLDGGADADTLNGGSGSDSITGGSGGDLLSGGEGDDTLDGGGGGADTVAGEGGNDLIVVRAGPAAFYEGQDGDDTFELIDIGLTEIIGGGSGTDTLVVPGAATLFGAIIRSVETLALSIDGVALTAAQLEGFTTVTGIGGTLQSALQILLGGVAVTDLQGLTRLDIIGSGDADLLTFTTAGAVKTGLSAAAGDGADVIAAAEGHDTLDGGDGGDILLGGDGNDSLRGGGNEADTLDGGNGEDTLDGGGGLDDLAGGEGKDTLVVQAGAMARFRGDGGDDLFDVISLGVGDSVVGGDGIDTFDARDGAIIVGGSITGVENLALDTGALTIGGATLGAFTRIVASAGATEGVLAVIGTGGGTFDVQDLATLTLTGDGDTQLLGFATPTATKTAIVADAGGGDDTVFGADGNDSLSGSGGKDLLAGNDGRDTLDGGGGDDILNGGGSKDRIAGGSGFDTLNGGRGKDVLEGGLNADTFRYNAADEGGDKLRDFISGGDVLEFSASGFGGGLMAGRSLLADQLVVHASNAATSAAGVGQFIFNTAKNTLRWDIDGAGGADSVLIAEMQGVALVLTTDFSIVA